MPKSAEIVYLDSSALFKLIDPEQETPGLRSFLETRPERASAAVARVEVVRAARRRNLDLGDAAQTLLEGLDLIALTDDLLDTAGRLEPALLRSLDAIHVAAALEIGAGVVVFITYDQRQAEAARGAGLQVVSPAEPAPDDAV